MKWSSCHSVTFACAAAALSLVYLRAGAQGMSAKATVASASPEAQISLLRQQMSALEARVHELEKHADDAKSSDDDDAKEKKLEKRLAAIDQAEEKLQSAQETAQKRESEQEAGQQQGASHARAPFVVYDKDDRPIFRVELGPRGPRMTIGNPLGTRAVLGTADDVKLAGLQLFDGADSEGARVSLYGTPIPALTMTSTGKKQQTTLGGSSDGSFGLTFSGGSTPAGFLGAKADGKGYLELNDSSGLKMVEAGSLDKHKGYVLTTPYHASVTLGGDPSVLLGGSGR
jgi:hypothetical protein